MSDELRDRIAEALRRETDNGGSRTEDYAQAVIEDLGLVVERANGREETFQRAVGKWER